MSQIAFLFDLDGVLVDTKELHWQAWQILAKKYDTFNMSYEQFLVSFGKTNQYILDEFIPNVPPAQRKILADEKESAFRSLPIEDLKLLKGVVPFLNLLKERGVPKIIASSTPVANLEALLKKTELGTYFNAYVSAEQVKRGKPFPDVFIEAALRLEWPAKDCIVIEDSQAGIDAGKDAQCFVIAVTTTHSREKLYNYDICVDSLDEVNLDALKS